MKLRPYQIEGAKWLLKAPQRLLADDPGLGKSAQVAHAFDALYAGSIEGFRPKAALIVCPAIARATWKHEFEKFSILNPDFDLMFSKFDAANHKLGHSVASSFELAADYGLEWCHKTKFDVLVVDEVHFLKSVNAKRAKAILGVGGLAHKIKRVWALSGTPADNHAGELWIMLYSFGVTSLSYEKFIDRYCDSYSTGPYAKLRITGTKKAMIPEIKTMLSKVMLRRKKEDVLKELPPITFGQVVVRAGYVPQKFCMPDDELKLKQEMGILTNALNSPDEMASLEALAGSVSTLRRFNGLQKVDGVAELIKSELELGLYKKIVIFGSHIDVLEWLRDRLEHYDPVMITGKTASSTRQYFVEQFQNDPKTRIFIGNIKACGTNITLTAADQVLMVEREWVPSWNSQAIQRLHRIGQTGNVMCRSVVLMDSLDQRIDTILTRKEAQLTEVFAAPDL